MNINIREYIVNNFKDSDKAEIKDSILASVESKDEVVLPGLGVLFEIVWENSSNDFKEEILNILEQNMKKK